MLRFCFIPRFVQALLILWIVLSPTLLHGSWIRDKRNQCWLMMEIPSILMLAHYDDQNLTRLKLVCRLYRWTLIWRTTVRQTFGYGGRYAWSKSHAYQVCVISWRILHMTDLLSWSHWVCHIQVRLYMPTGYMHAHPLAYKHRGDGLYTCLLLDLTTFFPALIIDKRNRESWGGENNKR